MKKGIDISVWQGDLSLEDFELIKEQVDFVIIRCGYTSYGKSKNKFKDRYFEQNYSFCKQLGIPVGTYYYSCATNKEEAMEEANFILELIKDKQFEYPIAIDTEDNHDINDLNNSNISQYSIGKEQLTEIIKIICQTIESNNYYVSIYASTSWLRNQLNLTQLTEYDKWIAQWGESVSFEYPYGMWQYSSIGKISGIRGSVDLNYSYKNFPEIMKEIGLNGFTKNQVIEDENNQDIPIEIPEEEPIVIPEEKNSFWNRIKEVFVNFINWIKNLWK